MEINELKLAPEPYEAIATGRKTIESRLNDAKRQTIMIGDTLNFTNRNTGDTLTAEVVNIYHYPSFEEMFQDLGPERFGGLRVDWLLSQIHQFYPKDAEKRLGVVGIEFALANTLTG